MFFKLLNHHHSALDEGTCKELSKNNEAKMLKTAESFKYTEALDACCQPPACDNLVMTHFRMQKKSGHYV